MTDPEVALPSGSAESASAAEVNLNALRQSRTALRRSLTAMKNKIEKDEGIDGTILECRLQILESYFKQLTHIQTQIERVVENDNTRMDIDEVYVLTKSLIVTKLKGLQRDSSLDATMLNQSRFEPALSHRLPNLKLPRFDGKYSEYKRFISTFNNLVHNEPIPTIDKFNYLLNCLSDQALAAVEAFQVTEENYNKALERLAERFDNKVLILKDHISSVCDMPLLSKPDAPLLRRHLDNAAALRGSLLSLGTIEELFDAMYIHLVVSKLDADSRNRYNESQEFKEIPTWEKCYSILSRRCQFLENKIKTTENAPKIVQHQSKSHHMKKSTFVNTNAASVCAYCNSSDHYIGSCPSFIVLAPTQRFEAAKQRSLCINCLRSGHFATKCTSNSRCRKCRSLHHTTLHFDSSHRSEDTAAATPSSSLAHATPIALVTRTNKRAFIPTAVVLIRDQAGIFHPIRTLLDSCSELNFISEEAAKRLKLKFQYDVQEVSGIADVRTTISRFVSTTIRSRLNDFEWTSSFAITSTISAKQPGELVDIHEWNIPRDIDLADPAFFKPQHVDLLIGTEIFFDLLTAGRISLGRGLPSLVNSVFGWIAGGSFIQGNKSKSVTCNVAIKSRDAAIDSMLAKFWQIEEFNSEKTLKSKDDELAEAHFVENTRVCEDGRLMVRLPFKTDPQSLGQSFEMARRRFLSLERRLQREHTLKQSYKDFIHEYEALGHMSELQCTPETLPNFYIPHHCVLRPESTTTKLRVVFDASAKSSSGLSLNDTLLVGPTIQQELIVTLLTFRLNKYALTADVSKMFRQFLVDERDRKFQLILWRDEPQQPLRTFSLNSITYGLASAPFQAVRCLFHIADLCKDKFPVASQLLKEDFYVDDMLAGADTLEELHTKKTQITDALNSFGLSLSKWNSNYHLFRADDHQQLQLNLDQSPCTKTLGTIWNVLDDSFKFKLSQMPIESPTKRSVLSAVARIFDVLGLLSPIVIRLKILLQEMWISQLGWDDTLPPNLHTVWYQVYDDLCNINNIAVPRYVFTTNDSMVEIHGFADASQRAYGCCIYVRAIVANNIKVSLLIAKSKVAPVKAQSLPRLELCAALLLSSTWNKIRHKVEKYVSDIVFWSDSQIVLHWLQMHSSSLNSFVANRISQIQTQSSAIPWKHVPSKQNPADIVSRGSSALELPSTMWFSGPDFLYLDKASWPHSTTTNIIDDELVSEKRRRAVTFKCSSSGSEDNIINNIINNNSSHLKIVRILSFVWRVFNKAPPAKQLKPAEICLSSSELDSSFWKIVSAVQHQCFSEDIVKLAANKEISPALRNLTPFLHNIVLNDRTYPVLRVGGRLLRAPIAFDAKFPALLPKQHRFTQLYIEFLHRQHLHAGPKALTGILRQKVWIVNARDLVRKVVKQCVHCFHYQPKLQQQIMGNLPSDRLKAQRPFLVTGLDFCGPFLTSYRIRGKQPYKTYLAVFICFSSRAVHFELVSDLSTNAFVLSLKRFAGRRGMPCKIYCDNATNFVGARTALLHFQQRFFSSATKEEVHAYSNKMGFEFCFIPPRAPHFGGLWEAAVKSAKSLLVKNIGQANLTFEELQTVVVEAEAILNSRPICPLSDDPNDGEALTPGHLLIGTSLLCPPEQHFDDNQIKYLTRYQRVAYLKQQFWELWHRDYLHHLQQKSKWHKPISNVAKGQLAMIHEDNTPPQLWLLGRIVATHLGADGYVRVVELKTKKGFLKRPIHKIAPLPLSLAPQGGEDVGGDLQ